MSSAQESVVPFRDGRMQVFNPLWKVRKRLLEKTAKLEEQQEQHEKDSPEWAKLESEIEATNKQRYRIEFMIYNGVDE